MAPAFLKRAAYRVRQFVQAAQARWRGPGEQELTQARRALPDQGWRLFRAMPHSDQVHALNVWRDLKSAGYEEPELAQAALLHDVAKHLGGVTLVHRVAVVLIKALMPGGWQRLKTSAEPSRGNILYPLWAHANHPATGAQLAEATGCLPGAVSLIRRHQEALRPADQRSREDLLLLALQRADDDN
jgi:hypothetical protein